MLPLLNPRGEWCILIRSLKYIIKGFQSYYTNDKYSSKKKEIRQNRVVSAEIFSAYECFQSRNCVSAISCKTSLRAIKQKLASPYFNFLKVVTFA